MKIIIIQRKPPVFLARSPKITFKSYVAHLDINVYNAK